jgi:plasmid stabilization system protein ParE
MKIRIHDLAVHEFDEAVEWYELQSHGLGKSFRQIVRDQVRKLARNPTWYLKESDVIYKAYIPRFPYKILYTTEKDEIVIWAIAHMNREPRYWQNRLS